MQWFEKFGTQEMGKPLFHVCLKSGKNSESTHPFLFVSWHVLYELAPCSGEVVVLYGTFFHFLQVLLERDIKFFTKVGKNYNFMVEMLCVKCTVLIKIVD